MGEGDARAHASGESWTIVPQASTWQCHVPRNALLIRPPRSLHHCRYLSHECMNPHHKAKQGREGGGNRKGTVPLSRDTWSWTTADSDWSSQKVLPRGWSCGTSYHSPGPFLWPLFPSVPLEGIWAFSGPWTQSTLPLMG